MPTFIAIAAVIGCRLVRPRIPSVPKYFLAMRRLLKALWVVRRAAIAPREAKGEHVATYPYPVVAYRRPVGRRAARRLCPGDRADRRRLGAAGGPGVAQRIAD